MKTGVPRDELTIDISRAAHHIRAMLHPLTKPVSRLAGSTGPSRRLSVGLLFAILLGQTTWSPTLAQVSEPTRGFVGPDLGPASRPTGAPPNSGLEPGRQAFPPGDPNARRPRDPVVRRPPEGVVVPSPEPPRTTRAKQRRPPAVPPRARHNSNTD